MERRTTIGIPSQENFTKGSRSDVLIRLAEEADLDQLTLLWLEQRTHHLQFDQRVYACKPSAAQDWANGTASPALSNPNECILVASTGEQVVGYVHGGIYPWSIAPSGYYGSLNTISVTEPAQGQGIGTQLVFHLLTWFKHHAISLEFVSICVDYRNEPALGLYYKMGFQPYQKRLLLNLDNVSNEMLLGGRKDSLED